MKTITDWTARFKARFGTQYDYSQLTPDTKSNVKFSIGCPTHRAFQQSPTAHLCGTGCPECYRDRVQGAKLSSEEKRRRSALTEHRYRERGRRPYDREYYEANKQAAIDRNTARYHANKHRPEAKAALTCRSLVSRAVLAARGAKTMRTEATLGYTFTEFQLHIEAQFADWMSWANHGKWHVDHRKPVAAFIAEGVTDPAVINALDNLRPLSAGDNLRKGARHPSPPPEKLPINQ